MPRKPRTACIATASGTETAVNPPNFEGSRTARARRAKLASTVACAGDRAPSEIASEVMAGSFAIVTDSFGKSYCHHLIQGKVEDFTCCMLEMGVTLDSTVSLGIRPRSNGSSEFARRLE